MNEKPNPASALARIPGWENAAYAELAGGLSNRSFVVDSGVGRGVLKIDAEPRRAPYNTREAEAGIQGAAAEQGLANAVLYVDATLYLAEYVDGRVWTRADFDDDGNLLELAAALRRLHALPLTGRTFDAKSAARQYLDKLDGADPVMAERCLHVVESMRAPHNLCCCHNDLVAGNIIATPDIRFLDWEYACDNDPFFDLATIVAHHRLSTRQAIHLLDAYFDGNGVRWQAQLVRAERLYEALYWLWLAARS